MLTPGPDAAAASRLRALVPEITPLPWRVDETPTGHRLLWNHSRYSSVAKVFCEFDAEYLCLAANAVPALLAEVERLRDEVDRERCRAEYAEGHVKMLEKVFDPRLALAELEVLRLKRGDFTEEEFQNLCHNFTPDDREHFRRGCEEYQRKLFGGAP